MLNAIIGFIVLVITIITVLIFGEKKQGVKTGGGGRINLPPHRVQIDKPKPSFDKSKKTFYHGSSFRIDQLKPMPSNLTDKPVVFGTPSFTDAVIFSAQWTGYNFSMWGETDEGSQPARRIGYLEEKYPGAFKKLDTIGYIHYIQGDFRKLPSGLGNEYVCNDPVTPYRVEEINVMEFLRKKSKSGKIVLRTYEEVLNFRKNPKRFFNLTGKILCNVAAADIFIIKDAIKKIVSSRHADQSEPISIDVIQLDFDIYSDAHFDKPTIIIGDPHAGHNEYRMSCSKIFIKQDILNLVPTFQSHKTTQGEYLQYLEHQKNLFHNYFWLPFDKFEFHLHNVLIPQYKLREMYPEKKIYHVTGPSGSGKTTLVGKLEDLGFTAVDTDDITDASPYSSNDDANLGKHFKYIFDELAKRLAKTAPHAPIIFCGHTIDFSYLANGKFFLDTDTRVVYERLIGRTVNSICQNMEKIQAAIDDHSISDQSEWEKLVTDLKIRFPGFIPPAEHINHNILSFKDANLKIGYTLMSSDEIMEKIKTDAILSR